MESPGISARTASRCASARRTANKIQQDERQQGGPEGDPTASLIGRAARGNAAPTVSAGGRSPSAGDACEAPPTTSSNKMQRPALPFAASLPRSPRACAAQHRSPRLAHGLKSNAVDRESISLMMDDVLQKHTRHILQAIDRSTSTILEGSSGGSELPGYSQDAHGAPVDLAEEPSGHRARERLLDQSRSTKTSAIERVEEYEKEILGTTSREHAARGSNRLKGALGLKLPKRGELTRICKSMSRSNGHPWMVKLEEWLEWWVKLKNPKGTRCIDRLVHSIPFQLACVTIILANSLFVAIDANAHMEHYLNSTDDTYDTKFEQYVFLCLYAVELSLRALSEGRYFFIGDNMKWNFFDVVIVAGSIITDLLASQNSLSFLRVARLLNVVKVTRMFHALHRLGLQELQRMVLQVFGCLRVLIWCFGLLAFITYVFAIFFMYSLVALDQAEHDEDYLEDVQKLFGSMTKTMLTLLEATTGGIDWSDVYDVLYEAGSTVAWCFVLYVLFFVIAVWNIITATFVEKMAKLAKPDNEALAMEERLRNFEVAADLKELFQSMDLDSSHSMSHEELKACISSPLFQNFLLAHDVHIYEASTFLDMLFEHGDVASLNIETLVAYCLRIKGQATSLDLHTMRYELANGLLHTQAMLEKLEDELDHLRPRGAVRTQPATTSCDDGPSRVGN